MKNLPVSALEAEKALCAKILQRNILFAALLSVMMGVFIFRAFRELLVVAFPNLSVWITTGVISAIIMVVSVFVFDAFLYERRRSFPLLTDILFPMAMMLVAVVLFTGTENGEEVIRNIHTASLPENTVSNIWSLLGLIILGWIARIVWVRRPAHVILSHQEDQSPQIN